MVLRPEGYGLRVYDIRGAREPREIALFIPPDPQTRLGPLPRSGLVNQTEDVIVDGPPVTATSPSGPGAAL